MIEATKEDEMIYTLPTLSTLRRYDSFPVDSKTHVITWQALADHINQEYDTLSKYLTLPLIELVQESEPYASLRDMRQDYLRKRLKVSELHCAHPVFDKRTNIRFRILHDLAHCILNADFDEAGEFATFEHQSAGLPKELQQALYTEIVIQASYKIHFGKFPQQKMFLAEEVIR